MNEISVHSFYQYACLTLDQKLILPLIYVATFATLNSLFVFFCPLPIMTPDKAGNIHCKLSRTYFSFIEPTDLYVKLQITYSCINSSSWIFFSFCEISIVKKGTTKTITQTPFSAWLLNFHFIYYFG